MAAKKKSRSQRQEFRARGVFVFVMTPFKTTHNRQGKFEIDLEGIERNARYFSRIKGEKMLVICGGSGEFHSLSASEVIALSGAAVAGAGGRCKIITGVGGTTRNAVRMATAAQEVGSDAVLVMPHVPLVQRGEEVVWEHHRAISRAIDIGLLPFRAPSQTLSPELVKRLAQLKNVVAIKEESGAVDWVRTGVRLTRGTLPIVTGGGENMVPYYYLAGAVGFTTGIANLTLPQSIQLHRTAIQQDWNEAMEWRDYFEPLTAMRGEFGNAMLKGGLEMMGLAGGPIRDTGAVLDSAGRRKVRKMLQEKGVL